MNTEYCGSYNEKLYMATSNVPSLSCTWNVKMHLARPSTPSINIEKNTSTMPAEMAARLATPEIVTEQLHIEGANMNPMKQATPYGDISPGLIYKGPVATIALLPPAPCHGKVTLFARGGYAARAPQYHAASR